jgi:hypothetical protein
MRLMQLGRLVLVQRSRCRGCASAPVLQLVLPRILATCKQAYPHNIPLLAQDLSRRLVSFLTAVRRSALDEAQRCMNA